jgi:hypothetical protein
VQFVGGAPDAAVTGKAIKGAQRLCGRYSQEASGEPNLHEPGKHITFCKAASLLSWAAWRNR